MEKIYISTKQARKLLETKKNFSTKLLNVLNHIGNEGIIIDDDNLKHEISQILIELKIDKLIGETKLFESYIRNVIRHNPSSEIREFDLVINPGLTDIDNKFTQSFPNSKILINRLNEFLKDIVKKRDFHKGIEQFENMEKIKLNIALNVYNKNFREKKIGIEKIEDLELGYELSIYGQGGKDKKKKETDFHLAIDLVELVRVLPKIILRNPQKYCLENEIVHYIDEYYISELQNDCQFIDKIKQNRELFIAFQSYEDDPKGVLKWINAKVEYIIFLMDIYYERTESKIQYLLNNEIVGNEFYICFWDEEQRVLEKFFETYDEIEDLLKRISFKNGNKGDVLSKKNINSAIGSKSLYIMATIQENNTCDIIITITGEYKQGFLQSIKRNVDAKMLFQYIKEIGNQNFPIGSFIIPNGLND